MLQKISIFLYTRKVSKSEYHLKSLMAELQRTTEVRLLVWPCTFTDERKMGEETEERENDRIIETLRRSIRTFGQPLKQVNC